MTQATATTTIERELRIEAPPAVVYSHFTDPEKLVRWMGRQATIEARAGGEILIDYNGFDRMRGRFIELVPDRRVVFSWGWETLGQQTPPYASVVEVTLTADGSGTLLRLVHSGLSGGEVEGHATGWDLFLPFLTESARSGAAAQPPAAPLSPSEQFASRLNALLCTLRYLIEGSDDAGWRKQCPGSGWPAGVTAQHAAGHAVLAGMAAMVAEGQRPPVADFTLDSLATMNADSAKANAGVTREAVLASLLKDGPAAVDLVPASMLLEGPLLGDLAAHIEDIRAALQS